jgi:hypothetical protein
MSDKHRNTTLYVRPLEDTIILDPLSCLKLSRNDSIEMIIVQHLAPKNFDKRNGNRMTWMKYTEKYEISITI